MTFDRKMDRGPSYLLLLCLIFSAILSLPLPSSGATLGSDKTALLIFKTSTDTGGILDKTWTPATDPCQNWTGVKCKTDNAGISRVTALSVNSSQLSGIIPPNSLGSLTSLLTLRLSNNAFSGGFPSDVSNLNLEQLWAQNAFPSNGSFPSISNNSRLKKLHLARNNFSGPIPDLSFLTNLLELDLSQNSFDGLFPSLPAAPNPISNPISPPPGTINLQLTLLSLSGNHFIGPIPNLTGLVILQTLNLSHNVFNGSVPSNLTSGLVALDLSSNSLTGRIPSDLARRFPQAFLNNPGLCGPAPYNTCTTATTPAPAPAQAPAQAPGQGPGPATALAPVPARAANGSLPPAPGVPAPSKSKSSGISIKNAVFIAVGVVVFVCLILLAVKYFASKRAEKSVTAKVPPEKSGDVSPGIGVTSIGGDSDRSKLSFIDDSQQGYDLEDLLRASAEMLGKGSFGTAYKAVMESGMIVAVKRLRDVKDVRRNEFSQHMELLGRLKHPNIVPLRAYYYAREEKLLIYDFMPNGSLFSLLHGSRGPGRTPLEWPARLSIAQGVAKGLTYLHQKCGQKIPHANIKSSNVLMGKNFEVCISDFGLVPLMPSQIAAQRMAGYRAPEYNHSKKLTYRADVYSFGVLLLELLTGRQPAQSINDNGLDLPKWVQSVVREEWTGEVFDLELKTYLHGEEEMVTLLQVAMACVEPKPEERPEMVKVVEMLDGIRRGESVIDSESYQSRSTEGDYSSADLPQTPQ